MMDSSYTSNHSVFSIILLAYENNTITIGTEVKFLVECLAGGEETKDQILILVDVLATLISRDEDLELIGIVSDALHLTIGDEFQ